MRLLPLPPEILEVLRHYLDLERPLTNSPALFVSLKGRQRGQLMTQPAYARCSAIIECRVESLMPTHTV